MQTVTNKNDINIDNLEAVKPKGVDAILEYARYLTTRHIKQGSTAKLAISIGADYALGAGVGFDIVEGWRAGMTAARDRLIERKIPHFTQPLNVPDEIAEEDAAQQYEAHGGMESTFITFGSSHVLGSDGVAVFYGCNDQEARAWISEMVGPKWCTSYPLSELPRFQEKYGAEVKMTFHVCDMPIRLNYRREG